MDNPADAKDYVTILLKIAENCSTNVVAQQYVYTRMEEILGLSNDSKDDVNSDAFGMKHAVLFASEPASPSASRRINDNCFYRALSTSNDIYLQRSCSVVYAALLSQFDGNAAGLIGWITSKLSSTSNGVWDMALPALTILTRTDKCKAALLAGNIIHHVVIILKRIGVNGNSQHLYELVFVLWTLALGKDIDPHLYVQQDVISSVVELLAASPSRKVTRMCLGTLRYVVEKADEKVLHEVYTTPLLRILDNIASSQAMKQMNDVEAEGDFKVLLEVLHKNFRELSTFERWQAEIESGALR